jgi:uncharacterized protein YerC
MAGLLTYPSSNRQASADVGFAILQAGVQGYLTNSAVTGAATAQDLIDFVNAAVVAPGAESFSQRNSIARAIQEGKNLGDLSDARVAAATSISDLAQTYTWVSDYPASLTGQLGPNLLP